MEVSSLFNPAFPKVSDDIDAMVAYETQRGMMLRGKAETVLASDFASAHSGKIRLIFTSPPFPLNRKKKYGNLQGQEYVDWFAGFAPILKQFLTPDGSIVVEMGNAWEPGRPVMSVLALRALLAFLEKGGLSLCQEFICYNPARLPSPAQWVNVERIRVKDSFTHVWWMAPTDRPWADNRQVLKKYSKAMEDLLASQDYNPGKRPSEHKIGERSFLKRHGGAIPPNVITLANTRSSDPYLRYCRVNNLPLHPARMPPGLPEFFIKFLTKEQDWVMDPFGGSNTTGGIAESLGRRWLSIEPDETYISGSMGWFVPMSSEKQRNPPMSEGEPEVRLGSI